MHTFKPGQKAKLNRADGYYTVTAGNIYTVLVYQPSTYIQGYEWPAYVTIEDDYGHHCSMHASRLSPIEEDI